MHLAFAPATAPLESIHGEMSEVSVENNWIIPFGVLILPFLLILCPVQVLSCLVQIASVRRSLFNNAERAKFLSHLVDGVKRILENPQVSFGCS